MIASRRVRLVQSLGQVLGTVLNGGLLSDAALRSRSTAAHNVLAAGRCTRYLIYDALLALVLAVVIFK